MQLLFHASSVVVQVAAVIDSRWRKTLGDEAGYQV